MVVKNNCKEFLFIASLFFLLSSRFSIDVGVMLTPSYLISFVLLFFVLASKSSCMSKEILRLFVLVMFFYCYCLFSVFYAYDVACVFRFSLGVIYFLFTLLVNVCFAYCFRININAVLYRLAGIYLLLSVFFYALGFSFYTPDAERDLVFGVLVEKGIPRNVGMMTDPNFAGLVYLFFYIVLQKIEKRKFSSILKLTAVVMLVTTLSRGALFTFFVTYVLFLMEINIRFFIKKICMLPFLCGSVFLLLNNNYIVNIIEKRVAGFGTGAGRFQIWSNALELIQVYPFLGWGIFNFRKINFYFFSDNHFAHNTYIEILVELGLLGLFVYLLFLVVLFFYSYLKQGIGYLFLISYLIMSVSLSLYINPVFIIVLIVIFLEVAKRECIAIS